MIVCQFTVFDLFQAGGFSSAEDADSLPNADCEEKLEGAFCVWTCEELHKLLAEGVQGKQDLTMADVFCYHYDVKEDGNVNPYQVKKQKRSYMYMFFSQ